MDLDLVRLVRALTFHWSAPSCILLGMAAKMLTCLGLASIDVQHPFNTQIKHQQC